MIPDPDIVRGYAVASLWTHGIDAHPGEYQPDPAKVRALETDAAKGIVPWLEIMGDSLDRLRELIGDDERIGHYVHYDREGYGVGFESDFIVSRLSPIDRATLASAEAIAVALGPDDGLNSAIEDRYETEG